MSKVIIQNPCSCFLKSGLLQEEEFDTKTEAKAKAEKLLIEMSQKFCNKHQFSMSERFGDFTVYIKPRR